MVPGAPERRIHNGDEPMTSPSNVPPTLFLAVGIAIGAALGVALDNMAFIGVGVAIGAAFMAIQTSRQKEDKDKEP